MEVFFISCGKYEYDGRLRELIKVAKKLGQTQYITAADSSSAKQEDNHDVFVGADGIFGYLKFIFHSVIKAIRTGKIDILFVDNRRAIVPSLIIKALKKPKYTVLDVRELYILDEVEHIAGKIGCIFEKKFIKKSDIIICANEHRSEIMKGYYKLDSYPLVFENIRALENTGKITEKELDNKYRHYFYKSTIKIVSTSGWDVSRTNDKLVRAMHDLGEEFELFLIGGGSERDRNEIENIISRDDIDNVHLIGNIKVDELKYFLKKCDMGIVNYHKKDMNNKYCASGKIYEFIFEGLPVVTTENVTLVDICNKHKIGLSDDNYISAIKEVAENYNFYIENVNEFRKSLNVEKNNLSLVQNIKKIMKNNE